MERTGTVPEGTADKVRLGASIDPERIEARYPDIGAGYKRLVPFDSVGDASNHVLAGAILSPENTEPAAALILDFLAPLLD